MISPVNSPTATPRSNGYAQVSVLGTMVQSCLDSRSRPGDHYCARSWCGRSGLEHVATDRYQTGSGSIDRHSVWGLLIASLHIRRRGEQLDVILQQHVEGP